MNHFVCAEEKGIQSKFQLRKRGLVKMKGKGEKMTYIVEGLSRTALSNVQWKQQKLMALEHQNSLLRMNFYRFVNTGKVLFAWKLQLTLYWLNNQHNNS